MNIQGCDGLKQGTVAQQPAGDGLGGGLPQFEEETGGLSVRFRQPLKIQLTQAR